MVTNECARSHRVQGYALLTGNPLQEIFCVMKPRTLLLLIVGSAASTPLAVRREWRAQSTGSNETIGGLFFLDGATGIGVGGEIVFRTSDGGANWTSQPVTGILQSVWFSDANTGTAVGVGGNSGVILRTTGRGLRGTIFPSRGRTCMMFTLWIP
jgi:photosystem II stability/assembly factor-like uncharacterized protein